jgi:itaconyl-CoA hydratase
MPSEGWVDRYFEDFQVGDVYRHAVGRTISEADNTWFTLLTVNTQQLHFNKEVGQDSEFGRMLVNSCLTLAVVTGLTVADVTQHVVANLGWDDVRLSHPVFVGDTLWAESVVLATRPSGSRPGAGIVQIGTRGLNQDGKVCITFRRTAMVHRRDAERAAVPFTEAATPIAEAFAG